MPTRKIDKLTEHSTDNKVRDAISACIRTEVHKGTKQEQAIAMCYDMARRKTGRKLGVEETVAKQIARQYAERGKIRRRGQKR